MRERPCLKQKAREPSIDSRASCILVEYLFSDSFLGTLHFSLGSLVLPFTFPLARSPFAFISLPFTSSTAPLT